MKDTTARNVLVEGTPFFDNCLRLQLEQNLTTDDILKRSGLSPKTLERIQKRKVKSVQRHTIIKMARCFGVTYYELMGELPPTNSAPPPTADRHRRRRLRSWMLILSLLLIAVATAWTLPGWLAQPIEHVVDGKRILGKSSGNGKVVWTRDHLSEVFVTAMSPWLPPAGLFGRLDPKNRDNLLVYGLFSNGSDGGRLFVVNSRTGELIWKDQPDVPQLVRFYGRDLIENGNIIVRSLWFADVDGDGTRELIVIYSQDPYYPSYVRIYDASGRILGTYFNDGHLTSLHAEDLDGDGKDEILVGGTSNRHADSAVLLLLDQKHCNGGSVDSVFHPHPGFSDMAMIRLHLPRFDDELMHLLQWDRPDIRTIQVLRNGDNEPTIQIGLGIHDKVTRVKILLDKDLTPRHANPTDYFRTMASEWIREGKTEVDYSSQQYLNRWLQGSARYTVGHWMAEQEPEAIAHDR
ncbi:MAG: hypothetical protein JW819_06730 [Candidatus Krumholzibacteriota bacterium]|nr:hypothetical protein [Candidatus Krumholzibacteriota bacterium]